MSSTWVMYLTEDEKAHIVTLGIRMDADVGVFAKAQADNPDCIMCRKILDKLTYFGSL